MKESLGPQEGLGGHHILICRDILPLALLEGQLHQGQHGTPS